MSLFLCREARGMGLLHKVMCLYVLSFKVYLQTFQGKFKCCCWANLPFSFMKQGVWLLSTSIKPLCIGNSQIPPGLQWNQSSRFLSKCAVTFDSGSSLIFPPSYPCLSSCQHKHLYLKRFFLPFNLVLECVILSYASGRASLNALLLLLTASASYRWHS